jgi:hypothetical protein
MYATPPPARLASWSKHTLGLVVLLLSVNLHAAVLIPQQQGEISCHADGSPCLPSTIQPSAGQTVSVNGRFATGRLPVVWLTKSLSPPAVTGRWMAGLLLITQSCAVRPPWQLCDQKGLFGEVQAHHT